MVEDRLLKILINAKQSHTKTYVTNRRNYIPRDADFRRSCPQAQSWFYRNSLMPFLCFLQVVVLSGLVAAGGWDLQAAEGSAVPKVHLISLRCHPSDLWAV